MGLYLWNGLLLLGPNGKLATSADCCCEGQCCLVDMSDTLCATVVTNDCISSTGGTVSFDLTQVYTNAAGTVRVWQGVGAHCPSGCEDWYIQIGAECGLGAEDESIVNWFLCHDSCVDGSYKCNVDPPDFGDADWTDLGNATSEGVCTPLMHTGVPISSCGDGGAYDCAFELTVVDGACP